MDPHSVSHISPFFIIDQPSPQFTEFTWLKQLFHLSFSVPLSTYHTERYHIVKQKKQNKMGNFIQLMSFPKQALWDFQFLSLSLENCSMKATNI